MEFLDRPATATDIGGRFLQEEYLEWRVVSDARGIRRVELTTELPEYWEIFAAYEPEAALELVAEFANEESVSPTAVFGELDPFASGVSVDDRRKAFAETMLRPTNCSPYNDGRKAICCLIQTTNSLQALVDLTASAAVLRVTRDVADGPARCLTCSEAIPLLAGKAQSGRGSDPLLVERFGRLAFDGCVVAFEEPIGIYIDGVEHTRLRTPYGDEIPREWFAFSRGQSRDESADGRSLYQRVALEVPPEEDFCVSDLVDLATEQQIKYGGQIADLVQLVVFLRTSGLGVAAGDRDQPVELVPPPDDPNGCAEIRVMVGA
jgi:hypothetical protein